LWEIVACRNAEIRLHLYFSSIIFVSLNAQPVFTDRPLGIFVLNAIKIVKIATEIFKPIAYSALQVDI